MPNLVRQIGEEQRTIQLRQAIVTAVAGDGTCTIRLGASAATVAGVRRLSAAALTVDASCWVLQQGYDLLVIGRTDGRSEADLGSALYVSGVTLQGTTGRNWFKDSEKNDGTGLRVGAAWNKYGIYSETGDVVVGSATGVIRFQDTRDWLDDWGFGTGGGRAYMGKSGAHGGWAQFSHQAYWNSSAHYGLMHNGGSVLLSADEVILRYQNGDRLVAAGGDVWMNAPLNLRGYKIWNKAYNDDNHRAQYAGDTDSWYIQGWGGVRLYYGAGGWQLHWGVSGLYTNIGWGFGGNGVLQSAFAGAATGGCLLDMGGDNFVRFNWDGTFRMYVDHTNVKNFVIQHPTKTNRHLIHACLEGPEAAVYYRGEGQLVDGWAEVVLPEYFEALTRREGRSVQLTCIADDPADEWCPVLHATRPKHGKFYVGLGSGMAVNDQRFWWQVTAIRKDVPQLLVEPKKTDVEVLGQGPYTYYREKTA